MAVGTVYDLQIGKAVFNPENTPARLAESFGQFVYWGMWGPAFTVILLRRHDLFGFLSFAESRGKVSDGEAIRAKKSFRRMNTVFRVVYFVLFFVLSVVGWKKLVQNVIKNILYNAGRENLSEGVYFVISAVVAVVFLLIFKKCVSPDSIKKLEAAAVAGVVFGVICKCAEELKPLTERVRFREMVAYSNGFLNEDGMSEGRYSHLTSSMAANTDFSAFTPWYKKGDAMGIYSRADSFPSGHTCYSCASFLPYILFNVFEKTKKAAPYMLILGVAYTAAMGFLRMVAGAHYLTDVAAAAIIGYTAFLVSNAVFNGITKKRCL